MVPPVMTLWVMQIANDAGEEARHVLNEIDFSSLSTSHPQIPPFQQLGLQSPPRTPVCLQTVKVFELNLGNIFLGIFSCIKCVFGSYLQCCSVSVRKGERDLGLHYAGSMRLQFIKKKTSLFSAVNFLRNSVDRMWPRCLILQHCVMLGCSIGLQYYPLQNMKATILILNYSSSTQIGW